MEEYIPFLLPFALQQKTPQTKQRRGKNRYLVYFFNADGNFQS
jgi:hypothetical protein